MIVVTTLVGLCSYMAMRWIGRPFALALALLLAAEVLIVACA